MSATTPLFPEIPHVDRALSLVEELSRVPQQDLRYQLDKMRGYRDALFEHFAPFKVGDRVRLHTDYEIDPKMSWGWLGYERMMTKGATAEVVRVDWLRSRKGTGGAFTVGVRFDEEFQDYKRGPDTNTYVRVDGERHTFSFWDPVRWWEVVTDD